MNSLPRSGRWALVSVWLVGAALVLASCGVGVFVDSDGDMYVDAAVDADGTVVLLLRDCVPGAIEWLELRDETGVRWKVVASGESLHLLAEARRLRLGEGVEGYAPEVVFDEEPLGGTVVVAWLNGARGDKYGLNFPAAALDPSGELTTLGLPVSEFEDHSDSVCRRMTVPTR